MSDKLQIVDIKKLKITKVKSWAIYFDYDGEKYLFHESTDDYETSHTLYRRMDMNGKGKYKLEYMKCGGITNCGLKYAYLDRNRPKNGAYNTTKLKEYFCKKMTYNDFFCGLYVEEIDRIKWSIKVMNNAIAKHEKEIQEYRDEINKLRNFEREV